MVVDGQADDDRSVVLCIEDDVSLGQLLTLWLRRIPDVRVLLVGTRQEALRAVAASRPHVVLTDLNLPDAAGVTWVSELVHLPALRQVPVVVMSADATRRTVDAVTGFGVVDVLKKPVSREQLMSLVQALLSGSSDEVAAARRVPDIAPPPELLERCLAESVVDLAALHDSLRRGDIDGFEWVSHRLKGRAMMYEMSEVSEALEQIDATFRPDQLEVADRLVDRADEALERFRLTLDS